MRTMFIFFILSGLAFQTMASTTKTQEIKGQVIDKTTGEPIAGASVDVDTQTSIGTITDQNGNFRLWNIPVDKHIKITFEGYTIVLVNDSIMQSSPMVIKMEPIRHEERKFSLTNLFKSKKQILEEALPLATE